MLKEILSQNFALRECQLAELDKLTFVAMANRKSRNLNKGHSSSNIIPNWLSSRNIFRGGQNLLLRKFLLLCYCFRTKFQGGAKSPRGANCFRGRPPMEESQQIAVSGKKNIYLSKSYLKIFQNYKNSFIY